MLDLVPTAIFSAACGRRNLEHRRPDRRPDCIQAAPNQRPARHSTVVPSEADKSHRPAAV